MFELLNHRIFRMSNEIDRAIRERRAAKGARPAARSGKRRDQLLQELIHANRAYQIAVDKMDDACFRLLGINGTDGRCLDIIDLSGGISAGELARAVDLSPAAVTSVIDRLEKMGLVERARDPDDRRRVIVRATEEVDRLAEVAYMPMGAEGAELLADLSEHELEAVVRFLRVGTDLNERHAQRVRRLAAEPRSESPAA
jgi:DNA-binding MarR family transcriptional regulator